MRHFLDLFNFCVSFIFFSFSTQLLRDIWRTPNLTSNANKAQISWWCLYNFMEKVSPLQVSIFSIHSCFSFFVHFGRRVREWKIRRLHVSTFKSTHFLSTIWNLGRFEFLLCRDRLSAKPFFFHSSRISNNLLARQQTTINLWVYVSKLVRKYLIQLSLMRLIVFDKQTMVSSASALKKKEKWNFGGVDWKKKSWKNVKYLPWCIKFFRPCYASWAHIVQFASHISFSFSETLDFIKMRLESTWTAPMWSLTRSLVSYLLIIEVVEVKSRTRTSDELSTSTAVS